MANLGKLFTILPSLAIIVGYKLAPPYNLHCNAFVTVNIKRMKLFNRCGKDRVAFAGVHDCVGSCFVYCYVCFVHLDTKYSNYWKKSRLQRYFFEKSFSRPEQVPCPPQTPREHSRYLRGGSGGCE